MASLASAVKSMSRLQKIGAAFLTFMAVATAVWAATGNDMPPVAGIKRVVTLQDEVDAYKAGASARAALADQNWYETYADKAAVASVCMRREPNNVVCAADFERFTRWRDFYEAEINKRALGQ